MSKYNFNLAFIEGEGHTENDKLIINDFDLEYMPYEVEANSYEEAKNKALIYGHEILKFLDEIGVVAFMRVEKN